MKRIITVLCVLLFISFSGITSHANSAQLYWEGKPGASVCTLDENTPIAVESEELVFDLSNPNRIGGGRVTASYEMKNTSDIALHSDMVFPLLSSVSDFDPESVSITSGGENTAFEVYIGGKAESADGFNLASELETLNERKYSPKIVDPQSGGTLYTFNISSARESLELIVDIRPGDNVRVIGKGFNGYEINDDGLMKVTAYWSPLALQQETITLYAVGGELEYTVSACEPGTGNKTITDYTCDVKREVLTADDYLSGTVCKSHPASVFNERSQKDFCYETLDRLFEYNTYLMEQDILDSGYETRVLLLRYGVDFAAGETKNVSVSYNTVARGDARDTLDYQYTYDYLLSPAKNWAEFGTLSVTVYPPNTSPYIVAGSIDFVRGDSGAYTAELDGLPEGELAFTLYSSPEITTSDRIKHSANNAVNTVKYLTVYFWWIPAIVLIVAIIFVVSHKRKKGKKATAENGKPE